MADPTCRSCGARVKWATTTNGKRIPLDPQPRADGNLRGTYNGRGGGMVVEYLAKDEWAPDAQRYVAHFATCPKADRHRKR